MRAPLRPLRHGNFALVWSAALVSNIGSWMQTVAVGALVTTSTHQAAWSALAAAAGFLPVALAGPLGGVLGDRLDRRRWLMITTAGEAVLAAALATAGAYGTLPPPLVVVLVFVGQIFSSLGYPAYASMLPDLVDKEELLAAVALSSAQFNLGRVIGPVLAGVAIAVGSYPLAFGLNAASFAAVIVALAVVKVPKVVSQRGSSALAEFLQGVRATWDDKGSRLAVGMVAVLAFFAAPFIALIPAYAVIVYNRGAAGTSVFVTAQGIGAILGVASLAGLAKRFGRPATTLGAIALLPLALLGYYQAHSFYGSAVLLVAVGGLYMSVLAGLNATVQTRSARHVRARALSLYMVALGAIYPVGALVQGYLADLFGLRTVASGAAIGLGLVVAVALGHRGEMVALLAPRKTEEEVAVLLEDVEGGEVEGDSKRGATHQSRPGRTEQACPDGDAEFIEGACRHE